MNIDNISSDKGATLGKGPIEFHLFKSLPFELREEIYKYATPPRIVHVHEVGEDVERFRRRFKGQCFSMELDPTVAHFASNWRNRLPSYQSQPTLEKFGFTGAAWSRPWLPSPGTPDIPLSWLYDHPEFAWDVLKRGLLRSSAAIPALLHTCAESRAALTHWGYKLAFQTRTYAPRTWFHFDRDILYIRMHRSESSQQYDYGPPAISVMSGAWWHVGQFHPNEMRCVRRLALEFGGLGFDISHHDGEFQSWEEISEIANIVRQFGGLEELLLSQHFFPHSEYYRGWRDSTWVYDNGYASSSEEDEEEREEEEEQGDEISQEESREEVYFYHGDDDENHSSLSDPWVCVKAEEVDILQPLFDCDISTYRYIMAPRHSDRVLREFKRWHGLLSPFYELMQSNLEAKLKAQAPEEDATPCVIWRIPKVHYVHISPRTKVWPLYTARLKTLLKIRDLMGMSGSDTRIDTATTLARFYPLAEGREVIEAAKQSFTPSEGEMESLWQCLMEEEALVSVQQEEDDFQATVGCENSGEDEDELEAWADHYDMEHDLRSHETPEHHYVKNQWDWWVQNGWIPGLDGVGLDKLLRIVW